MDEIKDGKLIKGILKVGFYSGILAMHREMAKAQSEASDLDKQRFADKVQAELIALDEAIKGSPYHWMNEAMY